MENKPKYVASACLTGRPCRFDGESRPCAPIVELDRRGLIQPICPECLGGLKSPRLPCEQKGGKVVCKDGRDMTEAFERGAKLALRLALKSGSKIAILKSRSPSCGLGMVYDGTFSRVLVSGNGLWAQKLLDAGFTVYDENNLPKGLADLENDNF